jgi:putative transposase
MPHQLSTIGYPKTIRVDQGSEFVSRDLDIWAYQKGVTLDFSRPSKPTDNSFIGSFSGKSRSECLNTNWFLSLHDARQKMEDCVETTTKSGHIARSATRPPISLLNGSSAPRRHEPNPGKFQRRLAKFWAAHNNRQTMVATG